MKAEVGRRKAEGPKKAKPTQQELKRRQLSARIAKDLFTTGLTGGRIRVDSLEMVSDGQCLAAWTEGPVAALIERHLQRFTLFRNSRRRR